MVMNNQQLALATESIDKTVTEAAAQFVSTISQYKWELIPDSQLAAAKQALMKNDYIMGVAAGNPEAVQTALVQAAILGLDLTEGKRQGWLLPRKNQFKKTVIQLQVGYKGVEAIHQRMGVIDRLVVRTVRENDDFEWSGDDQEKPIHKADWFASNESRGPISGGYAITYYPDNSINVVVAPISTIFEKHRDRSESYKSYKAKIDKGEWAYEPPWVSDEQSMVEKTMAYIAAKQWPANIRDEDRASKILETLHETDVADYTYGYTQEQKDAFYKFIDNDDALGMYLFSKNVGIEVYSAITYGQSKAVPRGEKMKARQAQDDFKNLGHDIFHNIMRAISDRDVGMLNENTDGILVMTEKLLMRELNDSEKAEYKSMCEDINAIEVETNKD
jgi:phage RecT family recombinase